MGNASIFFRVFDIAFFAPGLVVLLPLWKWWDFDLGRGRSGDGFDTVVAAVLSLALCYGIGLAIHGVWRVVKRDRPPPAPEAIQATWLANLTDAKREELMLYFWYLRATCFNLALAIPVAMALWMIKRVTGANWEEWVGFGAAALAIPLLWRAGREFEAPWHAARAIKAAAVGAPEPPAPADPSG